MSNASLTQSENTLFLSGEVTISTVPALFEKMEELLCEGITTLDCRGISKADSSALSLIIHGISRALTWESSLAIRDLNNTLRSLAELYGVDDMLNTDSSRDDNSV